MFDMFGPDIWTISQDTNQKSLNSLHAAHGCLLMGERSHKAVRGASKETHCLKGRLGYATYVSFGEA